MNGDRFIVISGSSGGGKSSLLAELAARGHRTVPEPGRRIVAEERAGDGRALPWVDGAAFALRAIAMAVDDHRASAGLTFFDRGLIDAMAAIDHLTGSAPAELAARYRYDRTVFFASPWPQIFVNDHDRRHDFAAASAEHDRLCRAYPQFGYDIVILPRDTIARRADFVLHAIADRLDPAIGGPPPGARGAEPGAYW